MQQRERSQQRELQLTDVGSYTDSPSPAGTYDQGGNAWEWNEEIIGSFRGLRGGSYNFSPSKLAASTRVSNDPTFENVNVGFRIASIPEPGTVRLLMTGLLGLACWQHRPTAGRRPLG